MSEWQPIETAPKDGSFILLFTGCGMVSGFFEDNQWIQEVCKSGYELAGAYIAERPTHWMPLPKPPSDV